MSKKFDAFLLSFPLFLYFTANVSAQNPFVSDDFKISNKAGEAQSTVVPPGKNSQCSQGRLLVSNDVVLADNQSHFPDGVVIGRDLNNPNGPDVVSSFAPVPNKLGPNIKSAHGTQQASVSLGYNPDYRFGTNDHDLVSLNNGDVLFVTGAFSKTAIDPQPPWFPFTLRGDFGPGARSVVLVWRSKDCGKSFKFVSEFDPARVDDGSCALPQFRKNSDGSIITSKPYDMGGTDGQLAKVNLSNDILYMTFQCVGYQLKASSKEIPQLKNRSTYKGQYTLDSGSPLNKTIVAASYDEGSTWKFLGYFPSAYWRIGIVPLENEKLGLGLSTALSFGTKTGAGTYDFSDAVPVPSGSWGWGDAFDHDPNVPRNYIYANMWATTTVAHSPNSKNLFIVFPDTIANSHGYRLFFYDRATGNFRAEATPILPSSPTQDNFVMHLTTVDLGQGPVLLYWYDVDSQALTATIRGRLITGDGTYSSDFTISKSAGQPHSFSLTQKNNYWYGDYLTALGFVSGQGINGYSYFYYPTWVEPDQTIRFAQVKYTIGTKAPNVGANLEFATVPLVKDQPRPKPIPFSQWRLSPYEHKIIREYGKRREDYEKTFRRER